jgi:hypothetical protein
MPVLVVMVTALALTAGLVAVVSTAGATTAPTTTTTTKAITRPSPSGEPGLTEAECLARASKTVVRGKQTAEYRQPSPPADHTYDMRTAVWDHNTPTPVKYPFLIGDPNAAGLRTCVVGPKILGNLNRAKTHDALYRNAELRAGPYLDDAAAGNYNVIVGLRVDNMVDGLRLRGRLPLHTYVNHSYFSFIRDDCIENDYYPHELTIYDSLFDGCYSGISQRPSRSTPRPQQVLLDRTLLYVRPLGGDVGTTNKSCGFFKWSPSGASSIHIKDSVLRLNRRAHADCSHAGPFPTGTTAENSKLVWTGGGSYPYAVPRGMTVTTDVGVWNNARSDWLARH